MESSIIVPIFILEGLSMGRLSKVWVLFLLLIASFNSGSALEQTDQSAIQEVIKGYTDAWNLQEGKGFGNGFTEDADFVNIFGTCFSGKKEIEDRHIQILQSFLKGSTLEILSSGFREVQPGLVIALVRWKLAGYHTPLSDMSKLGEIREGIFTQVFVNHDNKWKISASQNTLVPN